MLQLLSGIHNHRDSLTRLFFKFRPFLPLARHMLRVFADEKACLLSLRLRTLEPEVRHGALVDELVSHMLWRPLQDVLNHGEHARMEIDDSVSATGMRRCNGKSSCGLQGH